VPEGVVTQQYPPDELVGKDYTNHQPGRERVLADEYQLRKAIRGEENPGLRE